MKNFLRTAAVSVPIRLGDAAHNAQVIASALDVLRQQGVQLALFPELCLTGATLGDLFFRPDVLIGGFHISKMACGDGLLSLGEVLSSYPTRYYTCHCTGTAQYEYMRNFMPRLTYLAGGDEIVI